MKGEVEEEMPTQMHTFLHRSPSNPVCVRREGGRELTLHLTNFLAILMVASQNAPLYLALTSVPTAR